MNFFSLVRSISPSTAWVCVSALTCRVMTCLASIWEAEGTRGQPTSLPKPGPNTEVEQAGREELPGLEVVERRRPSLFLRVVSW